MANGQLTPSHAEAIATAPVHRQLQLAQIVVDRKLSVKRTTEMAKEFTNIESSNREVLENIGPRLKTAEWQLATLKQHIDKNESLLAWYEFHSHPWQAESCKNNINGVCNKFSWTSEPSSWITRLAGTARFTKASDSSWYVEACGAVCAHCSLYEPRTAITSQS